MSQKSVLLIGDDCQPLRDLETILVATGLFQVLPLTGDEAAAALDEAVDPALILTYLQEGEGLGAVDAALWARSLAQTPVPLVVMRARYDEAEALTAFRMGVNDYLGLDEHGDRLVKTVSDLLHLSLEEGVAVEATEPSPAVEREFAGSR